MLYFQIVHYDVIVCVLTPKTGGCTEIKQRTLRKLRCQTQPSALRAGAKRVREVESVTLAGAGQGRFQGGRARSGAHAQ